MNTNVLSRFALMAATSLPLCALASSHREAPSIAGLPRLDGTDFYMFRSYEPGRSAYVTFIANYIPLQDPYGGPNYFNLDPNAVYKIHVDNDGDADSDLSFEFNFKTIEKNFTVNANGVKTATPLIQTGQVDATGANLNVQQTYTLTLARHGRREILRNETLGGEVFLKPADNIGPKAIPVYDDYARSFIYEVSIPDCSAPARVFVGQRKDPFVVNLGEVFDLINLNPVGPPDAKSNILDDDNVTVMALELPKSLLTHGDPIIGGWTTASLPKNRMLKNFPTYAAPDKEVGDFIQVSRLGMPLVNEVVIGLKDKNKFNNSEPINDVQFLTYVTNPTSPALIQA